MAIAKRVALFLVVNFLVVIVISFLLSFFNVQPYLSKYGLNYQALAIFCLIWGMGGAFISLLLSKTLAKWSMGVQIIDPNTRDPQLKEVLNTVYTLAEKAGLSTMPEVGIFESPELNAFATGATKRSALVAVSSGLMRRMPYPEVEAVIGHEITHISNGDMVTMTLLQGIVNAFVMFFARIIAFVITTFLNRSNEREESSGFRGGFFYQIIVFAVEIVLMFLGSMVVAAFSRSREFRADKGGSYLAGPDKMIAALETLKKNMEVKDAHVDQPAYQALKISSPGGMMKLFATHPPLDDRIAAIKRDFNLR
jgi:heat shock protein HtpX